MFLISGCQTSNQVGPYTNHENYLKTCVDVIMKYDCPDTTICAINCSGDGPINATSSNMLPINNYGDYYLRIRLCLSAVQPVLLNRYSTVSPVYCNDITDYTVCSRFIPPHSFIPVAIPVTASSIVIDSCEYTNGAYFCHQITPAPRHMYGNKIMFPPSFDVKATETSVCQSDGKIYLREILTSSQFSNYF